MLSRPIERDDNWEQHRFWVGDYWGEISVLEYNAYFFY